MDIAFVSGNAHLPQLFGGVEVNTHALANELIRRGHRAYVLAKLSMRDSFGLSRVARTAITGRKMWVDHDLGYTVFRSRNPWHVVADLPRPTIAVVQNGPMVDFAAAFARLGVPSVAYLLGLGFQSWRVNGSAERPLPFRGYIALSQFTAERLRMSHGLDSIVLPPLFRREQYATEVCGRMVTFINPVAVKGVDLALEIAALCPEIPFCFVRGWPLTLKDLARLKRSLRKLKNVVLRDSTFDMRVIYRQTRLLLVPSQWEDETWGRVVTEAQFSGIPAIASNRGGLPEAVGPGGMILRHDEPAKTWAAAVRELWSDERRYQQLSSRALQHAARPEMNTDKQISLLIDALERFSA
ncbi:MAG TPA: glycosyltransferase [Bryobacteraceae bacterium]|nr:glycosyltransferase [Bryobacteraceae bacterium]